MSNSLSINIEAENKEILSRYRKLMRAAKPLLKEHDAKLIKKAFNVAVEAHKEMRRKSGEPYIYHPIAVAQICIEEIGLGTTSIVAALLHDVVEDTDLEIRDIERDFGPKVARIIDGLTKISGVFDNGSSQQAENFRKMLLTLSDDVRVILIKLADRLHNMRTLESMPRDKQLKIASETIYLYAPLAHRLGLYAIKSELEDMYLKITDPEAYQHIVDKIQETKAARNKFIKEFIEPIDYSLHKARLDYQIKARVKSVFSIHKKMHKQSIPFEEVYDLFAIRVIVDTDEATEKAACWRVYSIVTDFYRPSPERLRDWISTPKANGYESLHTTVMSPQGKWVEVQIRSLRMDEIAEKGYAAHWKYKESQTGKSPNAETGLELWLQKVRDLIENQDFSAIEFLNEFRQNLFQEEVFVFTPKGQIKTLPFGASTLDFAFEIHTQIGMKCLGAKVNNKLVPITYKLQNGDQVEILTSSKQKPSDDWLKHVVSSKARTAIKDALKEQKKSIAQDGREILERKLSQLKVNMSAELMNQLISFFKVKSALDLHYNIAKEIIDVKELKRALQQGIWAELHENRGPKRPDDAEQLEVRKVKDQGTLVIGETKNTFEYTLAKCCNPIPGDDVFGFVTVNEGIKIHRSNCPNAVELMSHYGYRIIKAKWYDQQDLSFLSGILIKGTDRVGIINDVTKVISSDLRANIRSINIETDGGVFEGKITLYIQDTSRLERLLDRLKNLPDVMSVSRINP
jgi:guanosine-3',5'-bis(diphosphate) 3'-pyrophosphohydrolase